VAPEFLFTKSRTLHFYDEAEKEKIRAHLIQLGQKFPKVLIVPGTVAWTKTLQRPATVEKVQDEERYKRRLKKLETNEERDFSKYLKKYSANLGITTTDKTLKGVIDIAQEHQGEMLKQFQRRLEKRDLTLRIARNTAFILWGGAIYKTYHKRFEAVTDAGVSDEMTSQDDYKNTIFMPGDRPATFSIEGLNIGVEICADNAHSSLKTVTAGLHLQIVVSAYTQIPEDTLALGQGGILVQADSKNPNVARALVYTSITSAGAQRVTEVDPYTTSLVDKAPVGDIAYHDYLLYPTPPPITFAQ
jgi:predicted amidohydrolase